MQHKCPMCDYSFSSRFTRLGDRERSWISNGIALVLSQEASDSTILRVIELLRDEQPSPWAETFLVLLRKRVEEPSPGTSLSGQGNLSSQSSGGLERQQGEPDSKA